MTTISNVGKVTYLYDEGTDTWYPVAGMTDASADFSWTGEHSFSQDTSINSNLTVTGATVLKGSINHFDSEEERDATIPNPAEGSFASVVVSGSLQSQYYSSGSWRVVGNNAFLNNKTSSYTIAMSDAGKTLDFTSSTSVTVTIPLNANVAFPIGSQVAFIQSGTGQISFVGQTAGLDTVTINSKNGNKKTSSQYTQSILVKKGTDTWYLFGDLTA